MLRPTETNLRTATARSTCRTTTTGASCSARTAERIGRARLRRCPVGPSSTNGTGTSARRAERSSCVRAGRTTSKRSQCTEQASTTSRSVGAWRADRSASFPQRWCSPPTEVVQPTDLGRGDWHQDATLLPRRPDRVPSIEAAVEPTAVIAAWVPPAATERRGVAETYEVTIAPRRGAVVETVWVESDGAAFEQVRFDGLDPDSRYRVRGRPWNAGGPGRARAITAQTAAATTHL